MHAPIELRTWEEENEAKKLEMKMEKMNADGATICTRKQKIYDNRQF